MQVQLVAKMRPRRELPGREICSQGDNAGRLWLLTEGQVVVLTSGVEGQLEGDPAVLGDTALLQDVSTKHRQYLHGFRCSHAHDTRPQSPCSPASAFLESPARDISFVGSWLTPSSLPEQCILSVITINTPSMRTFSIHACACRTVQSCLLWEMDAREVLGLLQQHDMAYQHVCEAVRRQHFRRLAASPVPWPSSLATYLEVLCLRVLWR